MPRPDSRLPRLLLASTNPGKLREMRRVLGDMPVPIASLADLPTLAAPEETGRTFAENAALKAHAYADATGWPAVAEDSGLAIDALNGRPGVTSARYPGATYADKFAGLYAELASHPRPWTARFVCALAVALPRESGLCFTAEGRVDGEIAPAPRGTGGFGYDPIFFFPPYARTLGEVSDAEKIAVSHRGQAFRAFAAWLTGVSG